MNVKTYRGREWNSVMARIKEELGNEALILSTEAREDNTIEVKVGLVATTPPALDPEPIVETYVPDEVERRAIRVHEILNAHGVNSVCRETILDYAITHPEESSVERIITRGIEQLVNFDIRLPAKGRVVALVGPTGVGKTTTIAKLAARLHAAFELKIGLIAADSFRVGAADHLQRYASIMNLPMRTLKAERPFGDELRAKIDSLKKCDLIFVDTAGCSARDGDRIARMGEDFDMFPDIERLLVMPASLNDRDAAYMLRSFGKLGYERIVLSKLDESGYLGPVLNTLATCAAPIAFFGTGQCVPEDIEPATARRLAWMIGRTIH